MSDLAMGQCEACRVGAATVTEQERDELLVQIPAWQVVTRMDIQRLERVFKFANFVDALDFTNKVGNLAEEQGHHPDLLTEWGQVTVTWWSHKIKGLHRNDFVMAARTDKIYA
jgi:4a-hydroxytetrahydrobiopterin dehydratase